MACNVIVQETTDGDVEIAAVAPLASMKAIDNPELRNIAETVGQKLQHALQNA